MRRGGAPSAGVVLTRLVLTRLVLNKQKTGRVSR
jgi:hypothetical protein